MREPIVRYVTPRPPYQPAFLFARLAAWDAHASDLTWGDGEDGGRKVRVALAVPSGAAVAGVQAVPPDAPDRPVELRIDVSRGEQPVTAADAEAAVTVLRNAWGFDDDLSALDAAAASDPPFEPIARRFRGARVLRHLSPAEALAWALIRQRTPHGFARDSLVRVRDALGPSVHVDGRRWTAFPDLATLASDEARPGLLAATRNTRKVDRLHAASQTLADLDPERLRRDPIDRVRAALARGHGVGRWTVDYLTLLGLGRVEAVPWSDTGLAQAVADAYAGGLTIDRPTMRMLASRYEGTAGVWAHWLKRARHGWRGY